MKPKTLTLCGLIALLAVALAPALHAQGKSTPREQRRIVVSRSARILERNGLRFKDLNKNGVLDPYEDWRLSPSARAEDLVRRMTLEEKAGMMMHGTARSAGPMGIVGTGTGYDLAAIGKLIRDSGVNSFITRLSGDPRLLAAQNNSLQEMAELTRLGIPVTISTDPRNHFQYVVGASVQSSGFSKWPETLGLAAIRDAKLVQRFADIARQEYRSVGIHETLSPQADLATEPRWSRINGTFGEDPDLTRDLVKAYVEGFQHGASGVDSAGVLAVVKHWVGYGAQKNGYDSHSSYGRFASFSGGLDTHIKPFLGAFAAHVGGVMPTYSILEGATLSGRPLEQVGAGFNRQLLTDLLRKRYGFKGIILTDWLITADCADLCRNGSPAGQRPTFAGLGMPWGVEDLPKVDRFAKAVNAGVDQFGGVEEAQLIVQAVRSGKITESRVNESVHRIAVQKFRQGLFENPYVDTAAAGRFVGNPQFQAEANAAQRRSLVLLENRGNILPLAARGKRVFLHGIDSATAARYGFTVVTDLSQAEVAIVRTNAPFQTLHPNYVFGAMQHEGDLGFRNGDPEFEAIKRITAAVPTVVTIYLDRPAILTELRQRALALVANFGVSDAALLDVLTGAARPEARLPFELPSSMDEVEAQRSDLPHDTAHPLYRIGYGTTGFTVAHVGSDLVATNLAASQTPLEGRWEGAINSREGKQWPVRADIVREGGEIHAYLDFPAYSLYYRRARLEKQDSLVRITFISGRDTAIFGGSKYGAFLSGPWTGLGISAMFALRRIADAPPRLVEQTVHFPNDDVSLAGRLVKPAGAGPWPAVVWTHGSGRQTRDADFYRDRAYLLAQRGIASLIYDKRGVGESTGDPDATLDELAGDAVAGVMYLRNRPDIRADHVGVGGFSQGGYVAPLAAARYGQIAFVVVGSAPGVTPAGQNDFAAQSALERSGADTRDINRAMRLRREVAEFQHTGARRAEVEGDLAAAKSERWFRAADLPSGPVDKLGSRGLAVLDFDPLPIWSRVDVPVLAMWGAQDQLVPAATSQALIENAMLPRTRARATFRIFPDASHGFLIVTPRGAPWDWPRLAPGFHELMADWIVRTAVSR